MQRLADVIPFEQDGVPATQSKRSLASALFADTLVELGKSAIGQFNPGGIGGANGTQGRFEADSRVNAWDFVLMIEGALLLAGSVARRLGAGALGRGAFPFTVESVAVGYGSATASEETSDGSRSELWLPLWSAPSTFAEVKQLFAEGRAQFGRRQASNAVEFSLAVSLLGVSRGISSFARYGFLKRNGLAFLAAPLGRMQVTLRPKARLLDDPPLTAWLDQVRRACRDKEKTPTRYLSALRQIDRTMFEFANRSGQGNDAGHLLAVMRALGQAERTLSNGLTFCKEKYLRPLSGLNPQWLGQANDDSPEFRLAASLAGIRSHGAVGPLRVFLEEVEVTKFVNWSPGSTSATWSRRPLAANLAAIFRRRMMEAFRDTEVWKKAGVPLSSPRPSRLADLNAFLRDELDEAKLADLIWGLSAVQWGGVDFQLPEADDDGVPFEFGVPRLLVEPRTITAMGSNWRLDMGDEPNARPESERPQRSRVRSARCRRAVRGSSRQETEVWRSTGSRPRKPRSLGTIARHQVAHHGRTIARLLALSCLQP